MEIKTFVFFDIETTGLLGPDPPKITEIAFTACLRDHLLDATEAKIPRAMHKLLLPINPQKVIHPESTRITGMDNFLLEYHKKMDANTIDLMNCFFNQLSKPVCLVAHNGNGFDFPILKAHLKKLGSSFDADLLCVDSLQMFRRIDQEKSTDSAIDEFLNTDLKAIQHQNEKTPSKSSAFAVITRDPDAKPSAAKRLFLSPSSSSSQANISANTSTPSNSQSTPRISYALTEIYKRAYGREPFAAHNADADTMHLLMCAIAIKKEFVQMADSMPIKFTEMK